MIKMDKISEAHCFHALNNKHPERMKAHKVSPVIVLDFCLRPFSAMMMKSYNPRGVGLISVPIFPEPFLKTKMGHLVSMASTEAAPVMLTSPRKHNQIVCSLAEPDGM